MATTRQKFSSQAQPQLLEALREIARTEGRYFQEVPEDAMRQYLEVRSRDKPRPEVMAHFRASVERNYRLYELLAQ